MYHIRLRKWGHIYPVLNVNFVTGIVDWRGTHTSLEKCLEVKQCIFKAYETLGDYV